MGVEENVAKTQDSKKPAKKAFSKNDSAEQLIRKAQALGCCEKFRRKPKACSSCPLLCHLTKKQRKKQIKKLSRKAA